MAHQIAPSLFLRERGEKILEKVEEDEEERKEGEERVGRRSRLRRKGIDRRGCRRKAEGEAGLKGVHCLPSRADNSVMNVTDARPRSGL